MHNIIKQIQNDVNVLCEDSVQPAFLKACQDYLKDTYQMQLPSDYKLMLKYANGIHTPLATIFGVKPSTISDVLAANEDNQLFNKNNFLIIGYDCFDWLVYNQEENCFQTYDKHDCVLMDSAANLKDIIAQWFIIPEE